ncbi:hypothetical protein K505DRAFT_340671 [Melanomma pulvis-pyrius CBS 109.77]|uniref:Uncharacterized protein n=1 Tax=Melanomma pulvis-pyrius CBS 109.77 TaxID=1314802 RepID=A0A6A6X204_9PLEO|nr:hypothetical protein K505DRAFT_340671 [Melanomma pulvis-pyrius CBS 109.77]
MHNLYTRYLPEEGRPSCTTRFEATTSSCSQAARTPASTSRSGSVPDPEHAEGKTRAARMQSQGWRWENQKDVVIVLVALRVFTALLEIDAHVVRGPELENRKGLPKAFSTSPSTSTLSKPLFAKFNCGCIRTTTSPHSSPVEWRRAYLVPPTNGNTVFRKSKEKEKDRQKATRERESSILWSLLKPKSDPLQNLIMLEVGSQFCESMAYMSNRLATDHATLIQGLCGQLHATYQPETTHHVRRRVTRGAVLSRGSIFNERKPSIKEDAGQNRFNGIIYGSA